MTKTCYDTVREAINALEFYETAYASSQDYQNRKAEIIGILKSRAADKPPTPGAGLALALANALESKA